MTDDPELLGLIEDLSVASSDFVRFWKQHDVFEKYGINVLADDSGLEVTALNGRPGVYSARYAGEPSDATANNIKLIKELKGASSRLASFKTVITLILDGKIHSFMGEVNGHIKETFDGEVGFGYNPIFIPDGYQQTFHTMDAALRLRLNHRGKAMEKVLAFLEQHRG